MRHLFLLLLCTSLALAGNPAGLYPDPKLTPGVAADVTQKQVIVTGYTIDARHVTNSVKWQVLVRYGVVTGPMDHMKLTELLKSGEVDHFISLELWGKLLNVFLEILRIF